MVSTPPLTLAFFCCPGRSQQSPHLRSSPTCCYCWRQAGATRWAYKQHGSLASAPVVGKVGEEAPVFTLLPVEQNVGRPRLFSGAPTGLDPQLLSWRLVGCSLFDEDQEEVPPSHWASSPVG